MVVLKWRAHGGSFSALEKRDGGTESLWHRLVDAALVRSCFISDAMYTTYVTLLGSVSAKSGLVCLFSCQATYLAGHLSTWRSFRSSPSKAFWAFLCWGVRGYFKAVKLPKLSILLHLAVFSDRVEEAAYAVLIADF